MSFIVFKRGGGSAAPNASFSLFKHFVKKNWLVWLGVLLFIHMELLVCIFMMSLIADITSQMSSFIPGLGEMNTKVKVDGQYALSYIATLYPMYMCMFPLIFIVFVIHKLMSKSVDTTSISTYFAAGITRKQYAITAFVFVAAALACMFFVTFIICGIAMTYWGAINWGRWLLINICFLFVNLAIAGVCFIFSTLFAGRGLGLALAIGVPVIMTIFQALSGYLKGFKYFTLYGWVEAEKLAIGTFDTWWVCVIIYGLLAGALATATVYILRRKQLSI